MKRSKDHHRLARGERSGTDRGPVEQEGADRFFIDSLPVGEGVFELSGAEAAHAAGSRRMRTGDSITLFDGSGWDLIARIVEASPKLVALEPVSRIHVGPPATAAITCMTALPKGAREDVLVSQCAQMGVSRIVPVEFARSVVHAAEHWDKRKERFRRLAVEAAKQSGASTIMELGQPAAFADALPTATGLKLLGAPHAAQGAIALLDSVWPFADVAFLVGPEGGMTDSEVTEAVAAGWRPVRISTTILRIETACVAFASVVAAFLAGRTKA
jgi:16S rRNA (uracil1498-N3)-methyltransferase